MARLTAEDRETLSEAVRTGWHDGGMYGRADFDPRWLDGLASVTAADVTGAVEQIVARHVAAALNDAADSLLAETHGDAHREVCEQQHRSDRTSAHVALDVAAAWLRARAT